MTDNLISSLKSTRCIFSRIVYRIWLIHLHSSNGFLYCLDLTHSDWASVPESMLENDSETMNDKGFTQWPGWIEKHWVIRSLFEVTSPPSRLATVEMPKQKRIGRSDALPFFMAQSLSVSQQINHTSIPFFSKMISIDWISFWLFFLQLLFCLFSYWSNGQHTSVINDKKSSLVRRELISSGGRDLWLSLIETKRRELSYCIVWYEGVFDLAASPKIGFLFPIDSRFEAVFFWSCQSIEIALPSTWLICSCSLLLLLTQTSYFSLDIYS